MQTPWLMSALLYCAAAVFVLGMAWRLGAWLRAPVPLIIVLTPGPVTTAGVLRRLAVETIFFRSLLRADRGLWMAAWMFHVTLVLLALGHVGGLIVPGFARDLLGLTEAQFHALAQIAGGFLGILAIGCLLWLLLRRLVAERVRFISTPGDYLALVLLFLVVATGNHLRFIGGLDLAQARQFVAGWLTFRPVAPPGEPAFTAHLLLVCALLIYIPFSKLVHLGGLWWNPTLNQTNTPRQRRHVGPWDRPHRA